MKPIKGLNLDFMDAREQLNVLVLVSKLREFYR